MQVSYKKEYLLNICSNLLESYKKKLQNVTKSKEDSQKRLLKVAEMEAKRMTDTYEKNMKDMNNFYQQEEKNRQWCRENRQPFIPSDSSYLYYSCPQYHSMIEYSTELAANTNLNEIYENIYKKISKLKEMQSILNDENSSNITLDSNDLRLLELY